MLAQGRLDFVDQHNDEWTFHADHMRCNVCGVKINSISAANAHSCGHSGDALKGNNDFEHILVTPAVADVESLDVLNSVMLAARKAIPVTAADLMNRREAKKVQTEERRQTEKVHREERPINEFEDNAFLFGSGFPFLFQHFDFDHIVKKGQLDTATWHHGHHRHHHLGHHHHHHHWRQQGPRQVLPR